MPDQRVPAASEWLLRCLHGEVAERAADGCTAEITATLGATEPVAIAGARHEGIAGRVRAMAADWADLCPG